MKLGWAHVVVKGITWAALAVGGVIARALMLPIAPINSPMWDTTADMVDLYVEQIGWPEFVQAVAEVHDKLPESEQAHTTIIAANPGAAGALNLYGPSYGLPEARSRANTGWLRGYGDETAQTVILVGFPSTPSGYFEQCETAGRISNPYGVMTEEMERPNIYLCRELRHPWPDLWEILKLFA